MKKMLAALLLAALALTLCACGLNAQPEYTPIPAPTPAPADVDLFRVDLGGGEAAEEAPAETEAADPLAYLNGQLRVHGDLDEVAGLMQFGRVERQWHVTAFARGPTFRVGRHRRDFQQSFRHGHSPLRACVAKVADIVANLALHYKHACVPPTKEQAANIAEDFGLDLSSVTRTFYRQIVREHGIPLNLFYPDAPQKIVEALDEARTILTGASTATPSQHEPNPILDDILALVYE